MRDLKPTPLNILWWHHVSQSVGWMARKMGDKLLLFLFIYLYGCPGQPACTTTNSTIY